jgi:hypothetical protein
MERGHDLTRSSPAVRTRKLLVVGSNPPTTSGSRTLARSEQARSILEFDEVLIANLFSLPTYRTGMIDSLGLAPKGWVDARPALLEALGQSSGVLLGYGVGRPAGEAGTHHADQVRWLLDHLRSRGLPVWWVGGAPRHPSRWQRYTSRAYPGEVFVIALEKSLQLRFELKVDSP